jgi:hypothetical protein
MTGGAKPFHSHPVGMNRHQIILLTHDERARKFAERVLEL